MPAHIREMFDTAVQAHEDPHRTVEIAMREMERAEKARDAVVIDEQNLERENGGLWQFYSTDLSELTVPLGPFWCQARKRQRVDLIVLPLRVETRAILAKEAIGILRRCVSWVTIMSPNASRSYRGAIASLLALEGFINPPKHVSPTTSSQASHSCDP